MSDQELEDVIENEEADISEQSELSSADTLRILEALLFASDELLTPSRLKSILPGNPDGKQIRKMVDKINVQLQKERHPFEIVEIGGGYQFRTVSFYHTWVRQIFKEKASKKLSVQALECLAIIAYKQPISKAEIEAIRGVVSDGAMKTLLEKRLVVINGRSEKPGRPLLYATSSEFLKYFGLNKIADLPRIEEFEAIAREKMDELSIEELSSGKDGSSAEEMEESSGSAQTENGETISGNEVESSSSENQNKENAEVTQPEDTQLFEVSLDDNDSEIDSDEQENVSIDDETILEDKEAFLAETDETVIDDPSGIDEKEERTENSQTDENVSEPALEKPSETETFDLEIAFDAEDIDEMLPADSSKAGDLEKTEEKDDGKIEEQDPQPLENVATTGSKEKDDAVSDSQTLSNKTQSEEEEVLEIFLPEDSSSEGKDNKDKE